MVKLTKKDKNNILKDWNANKLKQKDIAKKYGITTRHVRNILKEYGMPKRVPGTGPIKKKKVVNLKDSIIKYLLRHKNKIVDIDTITNYLEVSKSKLHSTVKELQNKGYNIERTDNGYILSSDIEQGGVTKAGKSILSKLSNKTYEIGVIGDMHYGSKYAREEIVEIAYDDFASRGIKQVIIPGNMIDGEARFNRFDLKIPAGFESQAKYFAKTLPRREGIQSYFITGECYDDKTEVMTRDRGFILFKDVKEDDEVATLNLETQEWEWQKPIRFIDKEYKGKLYTFASQKIHQRVTEDHIMVYKKRNSDKIEMKKAKEYSGENQFFRGCNWKGLITDYITIDTVESANPSLVKNNKVTFKTDNFMKLLGWYIAEGNVSDTKISISQDNEQHREEIYNLLSDMDLNPAYGKHDIYFSHIHLASYLSKLGTSNIKYIPDNIKSYDKSYLKSLLNTYWQCNNNKSLGYEDAKSYASSKKLADDIVEIGMKCGYAMTYSKIDEATYEIYVSDDITPNFDEKPTVEEYDGRVYCVDVPNETILIRSNNKVSWGHNCHEGWYAGREGINVGKAMEYIAHDMGRDDITYLSHMEHDIEFKAKNGQSIMKVMHPGGGTAYAISYQPQKIVESFQGGEKPNILLLGHYHKAGYMYIRNVHTVLVPSAIDQTPFMRKNKMSSVIGYIIIQFDLDEYGAVSEFRPIFKLFYDRSYYKNKWKYIW